MPEYDNTNRGAAWKNEKRSDTHPDASGSFNVEGKEYFLDIWYKRADASERAPLFSLRVKPKDKQPQAPQQQVAAPADFDSDIPF